MIWHKFSYDHYGYLTPIFLLTAEEASRLKSLNQSRLKAVLELEESPPFFYLTIMSQSPKYAALTPENLNQVLDFFLASGLNQEPAKEIVFDDYAKAHASMPYIGKVKSHYPIRLGKVNYSLIACDKEMEDIAYSEIDHLKKLKQKGNPLFQKLNDLADAWITHFVTLISSTFYPSYQQERQLLKKRILTAEKNVINPNQHKHTIADFILLDRFYDSPHAGRYHENKRILYNAIKFSFENLPFYRPLFIATALWRVLGVEGLRLRKKKIPDRRKRLTILESDEKNLYDDKYNSLIHHGRYSKYSIYLEKIQNKEVSIFFHELVHALATLVYHNGSELYFRNDYVSPDLWKNIAKEFNAEFKKNVSSSDPSYPILNYSHYAESEWPRELAARYIAHQIAFPQKKLNINQGILDKLDRLIHPFLEDTKKWCKKFIDECGLEAVQIDMKSLMKWEMTISPARVALLNTARANDTGLVEVLLKQYARMPCSQVILEMGNKGISKETLLLSAARLGFLQLIKDILVTEVSTAKRAFFLAANYGHPEVVAFFIRERNQAIDEEDSQHLTALHYAAAHGHTKVVKLLLTLGADYKMQDSNGMTALHHAVLSGDGITVIELLSHVKLKHISTYDAFVNETDNSGNAALHYAIQKGKVTAFNALLSWGSHINLPDAKGRTPLSLAIVYKHFFILERLLQKPNLNINLENKAGYSPFQIALMHADEKVAELFPERPDVNLHLPNPLGHTPLFEAIKNKKPKVAFKMLMRLGDNINFEEQDTEGRTCLHHATINGYGDIVRLLVMFYITAGKILIADNFGRTAWHWAVIKKNKSIFDIFFGVSDKEHRQAKDKQEKTILHWAAEMKYFSMLDRLIPVLTDQEKRTKDKWGKTASDYLKPYRGQIYSDYAKRLESQSKPLLAGMLSQKNTVTLFGDSVKAENISGVAFGVDEIVVPSSKRMKLPSQ